MMKAPIRHGGGVAAAAARYGGREVDWLDLSTGINPCPPALPQIDPRVWHRLPDSSLEDRARNAARDYYRSGSIMPLPVPGTQSVIQLLPRLVDRTRCVAIFGPTYGEYRRAFEIAGVEVLAVSDVDQIGSEHELVVLVNPNNPDGRVFAAEDVKLLAERLASHGSLLVVDEAFVDADPAVSIASEVEHLANVIVFRSFGKFFGMAGLRLGFLIATPAVADRFSGWLGPWAVSGPALSIATFMMTGDLEGIRARIAERRAGLEAVLVGAGLQVSGGAPLFALVESEAATDLHEHLCRHHILTRIFDYAPTWARFGLAPDEAGDQRLAAALAAYAGG